MSRARVPLIPNLYPPTIGRRCSEIHFTRDSVTVCKLQPCSEIDEYLFSEIRGINLISIVDSVWNQIILVGTTSLAMFALRLDGNNDMIGSLKWTPSLVEKVEGNLDLKLDITVF